MNPYPEYTDATEGEGLAYVLELLRADLERDTGLPTEIAPMPSASDRLGIQIIPGFVRIEFAGISDGDTTQAEIQIALRIALSGRAVAIGNTVFLTQALQACLAVSSALAYGRIVQLGLNTSARLDGIQEEGGGSFFEVDSTDDTYVYEAEWTGTLKVPTTAIMSKSGQFYDIPGYLFTVTVNP